MIVDKLKGKVVKSAKFTNEHSGYYPDMAGEVSILFEDGSELIIEPFDCNYVDTTLIESTLNSDVIPIGTNTLGEGSV
jgi:hypothetical protein